MHRDASSFLWMKQQWKQSKCGQQMPLAVTGVVFAQWLWSNRENAVGSAVLHVA